MSGVRRHRNTDFPRQASWRKREMLPLVPIIVVDCLLRLGVREFKIALGNVGLFNGDISGLALAAGKAQSLRDAIDYRHSARLVVNRAGFHVQHAEVQGLLGALRGVPE